MKNTLYLRERRPICPPPNGASRFKAILLLAYLRVIAWAQGLRVAVFGRDDDEECHTQ